MSTTVIDPILIAATATVMAAVYIRDDGYTIY
jgi:hypothetical protein